MPTTTSSTRSSTTSSTMTQERAGRPSPERPRRCSTATPRSPSRSSPTTPRSTPPASGSRSARFELLALQQPVAGDLRMLVAGAADGHRARADGRPVGARRQDRPAAGARGRRAPTRSCRPSRGWPRSPRRWSARSPASSPSATSTAPASSRRTTRRWTSCAARSFRLLLDDDWPHGVEPAVDIALLGRYYERIADHAVSVARRVVFLVTGAVPAHDQLNRDTGPISGPGSRRPRSRRRRRRGRGTRRRGSIGRRSSSSS